MGLSIHLYCILESNCDGQTMDKEEWTKDMTLKEKGEDQKMWTDELKKTEKELNSLFIDGELHDKIDVSIGDTILVGDLKIKRLSLSR